MVQFKANYALLMERFPQLALEIPAVKKSKRLKEPLSFRFNEAEVFYFYGIGQGEAYFHISRWLRADAKRRLIFLEDDLAKISAFLYSPDARIVLEDGQVELAQPADIDTLAERFPTAHIEIAALPSKEGTFKQLKEELLRKTGFAHAKHLDRLHGYQPFQNFVCNLCRLPESFYANRLAGKFRGIPAIVCGAGPSLKQAIPILQTMENKALIIAGGSTLSALSSQGINAHFGMAVDPNLEEYRRLKNSFSFEVPLLYSTRVFPASFQTMNGPIGYMRSGIGGVLELWIEEELGLLDPLIGKDLTTDALSVTSMCLAWAHFLGCDPILFSGVDLAYTANQRYAPGVVEEELDLDESCGSVDRIVKRKDRNGNSIYTAIRWLMESDAFSDFAHLHPETKFWNTTEGGIGFKKIPYRPLQEAAALFCDYNFSLREKVHHAITAAPMPANTKERIDQKMSELIESLNRIIHHLESLAGIKKGVPALAEIELMEEMAYPYLFYDALAVLEKGFEDSSKKWNRFLHLAKQYQAVLKTFVRAC